MTFTPEFEKDTSMPLWSTDGDQRTSPDATASSRQQKHDVSMVQVDEPPAAKVQAYHATPTASGDITTRIREEAIPSVFWNEVTGEFDVPPARRNRNRP